MHSKPSESKALKDKVDEEGEDAEEMGIGDKVTSSPSAEPQKKKQHNHSAATTPGTPGSLSHESSIDAKEAAEYAAKYRIYERDYLRRINHKYFSGKNLAGTGRVFETVSTVDGFTVKESREKAIKRFLELPSSSEEHKSGGAPPAKKQSSRKSSAEGRS